MHSGKKGLRTWEVSGGPYTQNPVSWVRVPPVVNKGGKGLHTNPHVVIWDFFMSVAMPRKTPQAKSQEGASLTALRRCCA